MIPQLVAEDLGLYLMKLVFEVIHLRFQVYQGFERSVLLQRQSTPVQAWLGIRSVVAAATAMAPNVGSTP